MQETWVLSLDQEDPLEKGMATHSSILAWRIPWTEKPGGLQTMGSQKSDTTERLTHNTQQRMLLNGLQMVQLVKNQLPIGDARYAFLIPGSRRSPGGRNGNPFHYSYLKNSMDRGAVHEVANSQTQQIAHTCNIKSTEFWKVGAYCHATFIRNDNMEWRHVTCFIARTWEPGLCYFLTV